jgi:hypothetical protein
MIERDGTPRPAFGAVSRLWKQLRAGDLRADELRTRAGEPLAVLVLSRRGGGAEARVFSPVPGPATRIRLCLGRSCRDGTLRAPPSVRGGAVTATLAANGDTARARLPAR